MGDGGLRNDLLQIDRSNGHDDGGGDVESSLSLVANVNNIGHQFPCLLR